MEFNQPPSENKTKTQNKTKMKQNKNILYTLTPQDGGATEVDPFTGAASGYEEPKFPRLAPDQVAEFEVVSAKKIATKDTANEEPSKQRFLIAIQIKTIKDQRDADGKTLRAGWKQFERISVSPTPETPESRGRSLDDIRKDLAHWLKCCGMGSVDIGEFYRNPSIIEGAKFAAKTSTSKGKDGYPDSTRLTLRLPA